MGAEVDLDEEHGVGDAQAGHRAAEQQGDDAVGGQAELVAGEGGHHHRADQQAAGDRRADADVDQPRAAVGAGQHRDAAVGGRPARLLEVGAQLLGVVVDAREPVGQHRQRGADRGQHEGRRDGQLDRMRGVGLQDERHAAPQANAAPNEKAALRAASVVRRSGALRP